MTVLPEKMHTRFTALVNIRYPIVQGGLSHLSYAELAAAVSEAGGLGQLGCACFATPEELRSDIQKVRQLTTQPFGVNFPIGHVALDGFLDVALEEQVAAISITGGNPEKLLRAIQQSGVAVKTMVLVAGVRAAQKAEQLGAHAIIAVGFEGGGHLGRDDIGTTVLVPRILDSVKIPVLASGGFADGRGLAAALALGADGIELGTRFVAVRESNAHPTYQQALVEARETDTVIIERAIGRPARVLKGTIPNAILSIEHELEQSNASPEERLQRLLPHIRGIINTRASLEGNLEEGFVWAGQAIGLINDIPTTRELIERTVSQAYQQTQRLHNLFD
ncbi:2-nitropropane dioxygenase [Dictyobacter arantiisoli]|uniref:2-nitropropane dioxygenase n=2 Tax=Dictyobacter arantiisoli TaxID=2014874 RepID=A0A5A5TIV2_9CHLR|nr:2-nitropropane dioxygenase [Dictyobacter arantiisoli]